MDRETELLDEAARALRDTLEPFRALTRQDLACLSGEAKWRTISFEAALEFAVEHRMVRPLTEDLYELPSGSRSRAFPGAGRP